MEEGGKLIAFLIIGMVFIVFAAFLGLMFLSDDKVICPEGQIEIDGVCFVFDDDFEVEPGPGTICPPGSVLVDGKCKSISLPPLSDEDDEDDDEDEKEEDEKDEDELEDATTTTRIRCEKGYYLSGEECIACSTIQCETDFDCVACQGTVCVKKGEDQYGKCETNPLLEMLYDYAIPFALLISYSIVALAFMVAKLFNSREAEGWAKIELREVLISTMYGAIIISFFPVFNLLIEDFSIRNTGSDTEALFEEILEHSVLPFRRTLQYSFTFGLIQFLAWAPGASTYMSPFPFMMANPFYEHRTFLNFFNMFTNTFLPILFAAFMSIIGQLIFLNFFEKTLFIFIGLGLFLRSFTFTRKLGGTVLAIVIGIFFILKLLMVIQGTIYVSGDFTFPEKTSHGFDKVAELVSMLLEGFLKLMDAAFFPTYFIGSYRDCVADGIPPFICIIIIPILWIIDLILAFIYIIAGVVGFIISYFGSMFMGVVYFSDLIDEKIVSLIAIYSDVITFAFFMPVLNFIIVIAGVKSLAETFGGDPGIVNMLSFI